MPELDPTPSAPSSSDWIADFVTQLLEYNASPLFATWAGVYAVGAALQRRVWMLSYDKLIYPNLYLLLVGTSGAGKGVVLSPLASVLRGVKGQYVAPASITSAALADELEDARVEYIVNGKTHISNSLSVISREFGVFLPAYDGVMLSLLTDLWDNEGYSERRRVRNKRLELDEAQLAMIGGTTPAWLSNTMPPSAWAEGFMSRMICVYSPPQQKREIVETLDLSRAEAHEKLAKQLYNITRRTGRIHWDPAALKLFNQWWLGGCKPTPSHPKLITYTERRHENLFKICLCFCVSRQGTSISVEDFNCALGLLLETEVVMPDIFKAMRTGGDSSAMDELWHFMYSRYMATNKKPVLKAAAVGFLNERVPAYSVMKILETMEAAGLLKLVHTGQAAAYEPIKPAALLD